MKPGLRGAALALCAAITGCGRVDVLGASEPERPSCPGARFGPAMVAVQALQGSWYCIDRTEVTEASFLAYLETNPTKSLESEHCTGGAPRDPYYVWPPTAETMDRPVYGVRFCDAEAFCRADGKRLCGAIGGGPIGPDDDYLAMQANAEDPLVSEWFNACSSRGLHRFGYPGEHDGARCPIGLLPVGSRPECVTEQGVHDLAGNASEHVNGCAHVVHDILGPQLLCLKNVGCISSHLLAGSSSSGTGIRCCAEVVDDAGE